MRLRTASKLIAGEGEGGTTRWEVDEAHFYCDRERRGSEQGDYATAGFATGNFPTITADDGVVERYTFLPHPRRDRPA